MRSFNALRRTLLGLAAFVLAAVGAGAPQAQAEAPASTLDRIKQTGVLRIGYGDTPPFSYRHTDGTVMGYSIDLCKKVAEDLGSTLALPHVEIEYVARTPSNRVQMLNNGEIDIECNASTNTEERRRSVAFAASHFFVSTRYVSLAKNRFHTIDDLAGRSVSVTLGTVNVAHITAVNRERKLNLSLMRADSLRAAFDLVTQERVSAFAMDDILLSAMIAESDDPHAYALSEETLTDPEPYGFMMRLGDRDFEEAVNAALERIYRSPEMPAIYDRWFNQPIPGRNIHLQLPMSDALKQAFSGK
ncbi:amino acid ABC transporter substrate-binding protein [Rhizobiaceae bacterium BDR2-2]|uniref:Amino acid ABC transporter substrate-binding protein n=1 Tax=Ectorhizobium quercum TaxID=2965071 RepID=A0AAE3N1T2_9HYPH|nr:amino acid ABC transporter substrate-binding protein [Ectorhizobium quercum]MCX8997172.1 amino acid ABC transporter substrate-binding protein [Ectorhizobium quercum]